MPFAGATAPRACVYERGNSAEIQQWLADLEVTSLLWEFEGPCGDEVWANVKIVEKGDASELLVHDVSTGVAMRWNDAHPQQRLKREIAP